MTLLLGPRACFQAVASIHPLLGGWSRDHPPRRLEPTRTGGHVTALTTVRETRAASFSLLEHRYALVKLGMAFAQAGIARRGMRDVRLVSCITLYNVRYRTRDQYPDL